MKAGGDPVNDEGKPTQSNRKGEAAEGLPGVQERGTEQEKSQEAGEAPWFPAARRGRYRQ